jgi:hypothetical protein
MQQFYCGEKLNMQKRLFLSMLYSLKIIQTLRWIFLVLTLSSCGGGSATSQSTDLTPVLPTNAAPKLNIPFENINIEVGLFFQVDMRARFSDEGSLTLNIVESTKDTLPDWIRFDSQKNIMFGLSSGFIETSTIISVSATDEQGLSTTTSFKINVNTVSQPLAPEQVAQDNNYISELLLKESNFFQLGIAINDSTFLTQDGIFLNSVSLQPFGKASPFSAASKESLHLNFLAKVVLENDRAQQLLFGVDVDNTVNAANTNNAEDAVTQALNILEQKVTTYEQFDAAYPAFGGFLPWFISEDRGNGVSMYPLSGWEDRMPALDNGQLAWSIFVVYHSLYKMGYDNIARRYEQRFQKMATHVKTVFFDTQRNVISGISQFTDTSGNPDPSLPPEQLLYIKDSYALTDPFEGELMAVFMTLFSPDLSETQKQQLWLNKFVNTRDYAATTGDILTVIEGWAFSSHEQWKFLILPYLDYKITRDLFLNSEKVRADYSNKNKYRGFFASVNTPANSYESLLGIQAVASQNGVKNTVIAPYANFPMLLADQNQQTNTGLKWLKNTLAYDNILSEYGVLESYDTSTFAITPLLTWDGKALPSLAMMGGVIDETREFMIQEGVYLEFMNLIDTQYSEFSDVINGIDSLIAAPLDTPVPVSPCSDSHIILGTINDFDCQKLIPLAGISIVENPDVTMHNPSQFVGQYNDPAGPWDALVIDYYDAIDLSNHTVFSLSLIAPVSGILKVKLEGGQSLTVELDMQVSELNNWVEYQFDFTAHMNENHQKIAVFFEAGLSNSGNNIYYLDNLKLTSEVIE